MLYSVFGLMDIASNFEACVRADNHNQNSFSSVQSIGTGNFLISVLTGHMKLLPAEGGITSLSQQ